MYIIRIVPLLDEVPQHCPVCIQRLWHSYDDVSKTAVYIRRAGVSKWVRITVLPLGWCTVMRIIGIVHLLYKAPWDRPICVQRLCGHPYGNVNQQAVQILLRLYQNAVCIRVVRLGSCTAIRIIGIVHLPYEMPQHLPICVQRLHKHPYGNVSQQAVQNPSAVIPKCLLHQSSPLLVMYCHAHFRNCAPTVRSATGSPNLYTKAVRAPIQQLKLASCTDSYSGCTKMRFTSGCYALFASLPCALSPSYTYCTRHHGISQFM